MFDMLAKAVAHGDQEHDAHVGRCLRRNLLGMVLMAVSPALTWAGLVTGFGWWALSADNLVQCLPGYHAAGQLGW
ncbi:hypothetical protein [Streptomyces griseus]